jgi:hypothetical protein
MANKLASSASLPPAAWRDSRLSAAMNWALLCAGRSGLLRIKADFSGSGSSAACTQRKKIGIEKFWQP